MANKIVYADETGISYRLLPNRTLEFKNVSCHGGKLSLFKGRLTTMVCANTDSLNDWKIYKKLLAVLKMLSHCQHNIWLTKKSV